MTSINRPPITGGGPATLPQSARLAEADADQEQLGLERSPGALEDGLRVDRHPGARTFLLMAGLGALAGGGVAIGASRLPQFALTSSFGGRAGLLWGGVAAAAIGATLGAIGLTQRPETIPYAATVDGSRADALAKAGQTQADTGVVRIDRDSWGIVDLSKEDTAIDQRGPGDISMGTPPVGFDSFVSQFGDAYVSSDEGWKNVGSPNAVDTTTIGRRDLGSLTGTQLGVTADWQRVQLGAPVDGKVHGTRADAIRDRFERGEAGIAVVQVDGGFANFRITGGDPASIVAARGFGAADFGAISLLTPDSTIAASEPAGAFERSAMPVDDVTAVPVAEAATLEGRRIGDGQQRLGGLAGTWKTTTEASQALFEQGTGHHVILQLAGGAAAYAIERPVASFDTMLGGPRGAVTMLGSGSNRLSAPGEAGAVVSAGSVPTIDVSGLALEQAATLEGRRIGDGQLRLGKLVGTYDSTTAGGSKLFEQGSGPVVFVQLKGGVGAYSLDRAPATLESLLDRGAVQVLTGTTISTANAGGAFSASGRLPRVDVTKLSLADAASLEGRRIGEGDVRLGKLVKTYGSIREAGAAQFEAEAPQRVVLQMADGTAVFEIPKGFSNFETLLGGTNGVYSLRGANWSAPTDADRDVADAGRVTVVDASSLSRADAGKLVGKRFAMDGKSVVRVTDVTAQWGSTAEAHRALASAGGSHVLVQLKDGVVEVKLDGRPDQLSTGIRGTLLRQSGRLGASSSGSVWSSWGRVVPFDVNEPIGFELEVPGATGEAQRHVSSHGSMAAAWASADQGGYRAIVRADGPAGSYHVYDLGGRSGGDWDERLGDVVGVSYPGSADSSYTVEGGSVGSETIYVVTERTTWRNHLNDSGSRETVDQRTYEVGRDIDHGATSALRAQRAAEREEARRRAEEEARRRAEEEARRQAEEEARRQREAEEAAQRAAEEAARRQREAEEAAQRAAEDAARREREAEEAARRAEEEAARREREQSSGGSSSGGYGGGYSGGSGSGGSSSGGDWGSGGSGSSGNSDPGSGGGYDPGGGGAGSDW